MATNSEGELQLPSVERHHDGEIRKDCTDSLPSAISFAGCMDKKP